jgi:hypothetical protein
MRPRTASITRVTHPGLDNPGPGNYQASPLIPSIHTHTGLSAQELYVLCRLRLADLGVQGLPPAGEAPPAARLLVGELGLRQLGQGEGERPALPHP